MSDKDLLQEWMAGRRMCQRCVLVENPPHVTLDAQGVCGLCRQHDARARGAQGRAMLETDLLKILNKYKGKNPYDCMVMCSGGKDSTASLYYMVKRYKLKVLAFMFDHGFETAQAIANVHRAVEILNVDLLFFRSNRMKPMFRRMVQEQSRAVICHPCSMWYMGLAFDVAARYEVPLIIAGWTRGQSSRQELVSKCDCTVDAPEYQSMGQATREFLASLARDPQYKDFPTSMDEVQRRARKKTQAMVLSPHWFLDTDPEEYKELIARELGWKAPAESYPRGSTNCTLNYLSAWLSMKHHGYTHYHIEASKLIRQGLLSRQQALDDLKMTVDIDFLRGIARQLGADL